MLRLAQSGDAVAAVALAEAERTPWLAPHLARVLPAPDAYVGWVLTPTHAVAYRPGAAPTLRVLPLPDSFATDVEALRAALLARAPIPPAAVRRVRTVLVAPLADWFAERMGLRA